MDVWLVLNLPITYILKSLLYLYIFNILKCTIYFIYDIFGILFYPIY